MKKQITLLLLLSILLNPLFATKGSTTQPLASVLQVDPLEKIIPGTPYTDDPQPLHVACGETATLQLVVVANEPLTLTHINVNTPHNKKNKLAKPNTWWVGYVSVTPSYTPAPLDLLHSWDNRFPDPLISDSLRTLNAGESLPIWIEFSIPPEAAPGYYRTEITLSLSAAHQTKKIRRSVLLHLYPIQVQASSLFITNWLYLDNPRLLAQLNGGIRPDTATVFQLARLLARTCNAYRQNTYLLPIHQFTRTQLTKEGKFNFDFSQVDSLISIFAEEGGMQLIEASHLARGHHKDFTCDHIPVITPEGTLQIQDKLPASHPAVEAFYQAYFPALRTHLEKIGWLDRFLQHIGDEPVEANSRSYAAIAQLVKHYFPDIQIIEALSGGDLLSQEIDIMVPQLQYFHENESFYQERIGKGSQTWLYTCCWPRGEYANRFIEQPLLKTRYLHWINFLSGTKGYLHWGLNYWPEAGDSLRLNPYQSSASEIIPAGDAYLLYPAYRKLLPSIRLAAMRDGIADYELLQKVAAINPQKAKEFARKLIPQYNHYQMSIPLFRKVRREILEYLAQEEPLLQQGEATKKE